MLLGALAGGMGGWLVPATALALPDVPELQALGDLTSTAQAAPEDPGTVGTEAAAQEGVEEAVEEAKPSDETVTEDKPAPATPEPERATSAPPAAAPAAPPPSPEPPAPLAPLAGISDGAAFLRSPDNFFQLFPGGRLQIDSNFFKGKAKLPNNTFAIKRARVELSGWVGPMFFFSLGGDFASGPPPAADPVAPANILTTDAFAVLAPWGNRVLFQLGQYDAPFTLENRTSDKYLDFIERSVAVRGFGIPATKEQGLMVHGLLPSDIAYYSVGVFNGDGQNFRNADANFDVMGRGWLSVLPIAMQPSVTLHVGGSFWWGRRDNTLPVPSPSTAAGFSFWTPKWTGTGNVPLELHQDGDVRAFAAELDLSVLHKLGLKVEWLHRKQGLSVADVSKAGALTILGSGSLSGSAGYAEVWYWPIGDSKIIGEPGLQLPSRWKKLNADPARHGLMVALRLDNLRMQTSDAGAGAAAVASPARGSTRLWGVTAGLNYWWSKRIRLGINYSLISLSGSAATIQALPSGREQEVLTRIGFAL
jgi:hypothetical protein